MELPQKQEKTRTKNHALGYETLSSNNILLLRIFFFFMQRSINNVLSYSEIPLWVSIIQQPMLYTP